MEIGLFFELAFSHSGQSRRLAHRSKVASSSVILLASLNNNRGKKLRQNRPGGVLLRKRALKVRPGHYGSKKRF